MTEAQAERNDNEMLLALLNLLLARRRLIVVLALAGGVAGGVIGLASKRTYTSSATFLPQGTDNALGATDLALAASQFGLRIPGSSGSWTPAVFVDLVQSHALLAPIVADTLVVAELNERTTLVDLFDIDSGAQAERVERAVYALRNYVRSREARALGAVELEVRTPWPSVSYQVADRVVRGVHDFNLRARSAQAAAEREFIEPLVRQTQRGLREAEDRLEDFLQRNRVITGSPELLFQRDRLEREVATQQQLYGAILQKYEEARIGERRNTPVITVVEAPRLPVLPNPRRTVLKAAVGVLGGALFGMLLALLQQGLAVARARGTPQTRRFIELLDQATPRFLRRRPRSRHSDSL